MRIFLYILGAAIASLAISLAVSFLPIPLAAKSGLSFLLCMPVGSFAMIRWLKGRE